MADFLTIHANLRTAMHFFGEATGTGSVTPLPGSLVIDCGLNYGVFNIAMLDETTLDNIRQNQLLKSSEGDLQDRLEHIAKHFGDRKVRWSLWLCEEMIAPGYRRQARQYLANLGMRNISSPPGMTCTELRPAVSSLPQVELHPVNDAATRLAFAEMTALCFEIPFDVAQMVYGSERAWNGAYKGFVAYADGSAVAICALVETEGALGIYSVATHPTRRRQGYGEAVMRAAIDFAGTATKPIVLQATEAGYALYRRMGFKECARFSVYLTK